LSFGSRGSGCSSSKAHLPHVSLLSQPGTRAWYPAGYPERALERDHSILVSRRLSATGIRFLGILFPPGDWAFLTAGLPAHRIGALDPDGLSMFRTRETRLGLGALYTPGTAVSTRPRYVHDRRLPHRNGTVPARPALLAVPDGLHDEASARVSG
jgi:hypothetical protein